MLDPQDAPVRDPGTVIFVCEGNTCRSPMAEVMAAQLFAGPGSRFFSAGLTACAAAPAAPEAVLAAAEEGLDLTAHRATPLTAADWRRARWAVAMTRAQAARLRVAGVGATGCRIGVLGAPGLDLAGGGPSPACEDVADPWGGDLETYRRAAAQIRRLLQAWAPFLAGAEPAGKDAG